MNNTALSESSVPAQPRQAPAVSTRDSSLRHRGDHDGSSGKAKLNDYNRLPLSTPSRQIKSRLPESDGSTKKPEAAAPLLANTDGLPRRSTVAQSLASPRSHSVLPHGLSPEPRPGDAISKSKRPLSDINYSFGTELPAQRISEARDTFCYRLLELEVTIQMSQQLITKKFTNAEAIYLTNLMFIDLIGPPSRKRLAELLNSYTANSERAFGSASVVRAEAAAKQSSTPQIFQAYFTSVSRATRLAAGHHHAHMPGISHLNTISSLSECLNTHKHYTEIMRAARRKETWMTQFLTDHGYKTAQGKNWASLAATYLCSTLGVTAGALELNNAQAAIVNAMVENFGYGILTIFPMQALWK